MDLLRGLADRTGLEPADLVGLAVALLGALLVTAVALRPATGVPVVPSGTGDVEQGTPTDPGVAPSPSPAAAHVVVHVAGEVERPGVHTLPAGARVDAAVAAAGGATAAGRTDLLNLARPLVDGEQVVVPGPDAPPPGHAAVPGGVGTGDDLERARLPDGRIDLNRADAATLEELPGIGEVTAARVLAWRDEHGPFTDPAQLREVRGIGEVTWLGLADLVGVG